MVSHKQLYVRQWNKKVKKVYLCQKPKDLNRMHLFIENKIKEHKPICAKI
jgi:hypothetical protein